MHRADLYDVNEKRCVGFFDRRLRSPVPSTSLTAGNLTLPLRSQRVNSAVFGTNSTSRAAFSVVSDPKSGGRGETVKEDDDRKILHSVSHLHPKAQPCAFIGS